MDHVFGEIETGEYKRADLGKDTRKRYLYHIEELKKQVVAKRYKLHIRHTRKEIVRLGL